jgi:subtilisin family serine protease
MAAPVVTGIAALLLSYFPQLTAKQIKMILMESAYKPLQAVNRPQTKISVPFSSLSASGGTVNAYRAVKMAIELTGKE